MNNTTSISRRKGNIVSWISQIRPQLYNSALNLGTHFQCWFFGDWLGQLYFWEKLEKYQLYYTGILKEEMPAELSKSKNCNGNIWIGKGIQIIRKISNRTRIVQYPSLFGRTNSTIVWYIDCWAKTYLREKSDVQSIR